MISVCHRTQIIAEVESLSASDVIVAFDNERLGWHSLVIPRSEFSAPPTVGARILVTVSVNDKNEIVDFGVSPGVEVGPQSPVHSEKRRSSLPPEPKDFNNPDELDAYRKTVRRRFD